MFKEGLVGNIGALTPLIGEDNLPVYNKCLWFRIPLFDYRYSQPELIFTDKIGIQYEMDHHFQTDGGSIPPILRLTPGVHLDPFNFPRSYLFHDCAYQYGGLYMRYPGQEEFKFRLLSRVKVDSLLAELLPFDGATQVDQKAINTAIWIGSRFVWDGVKKPIAQKEARKFGHITVFDYDGNIIEDNRTGCKEIQSIPAIPASNWSNK